jgi:hypothetical protein
MKSIPNQTIVSSPSTSECSRAPIDSRALVPASGSGNGGRAGTRAPAAFFAQYLPAQVPSVALGAFGLLAMMLAVTGIYGLASYSVAKRVR